MSWQSRRPLEASDEDVRKCGEEIKQLRNQQFILGTTAIGLFGVYATFLLRFSQIEPYETWMYIGSAIAILFILAILFYWTRQLRVLVGVISIWLEIVGKSNWEFDFREYHKNFSPVSQTKLASGSFFILGFGVMGLIFAMLSSSGDPISSHLPQLLMIFTADLFYLVFLFEFGFRKRGIDEEHVKSNWIEIITKVCYNRHSGVTPPFHNIFRIRSQEP